jgi:hypothetical protein
MSSNKFTVLCEVSGRDIDAVNARLKDLGRDGAAKAMKSGFRKWTNFAKKLMVANAPFGRPGASEKVRGQSRINVHIRNNVATKVKGFSKGRVVWAAVGIKEKRGTYDTPHWYLRWVEFGHQLKRKPTTNEASLLKSRGEIIKKNTTIKYGHVKGSHFMQRTLNMAEMRLLPMLNEAIDKQIDKEIGRG